MPEFPDKHEMCDAPENGQLDTPEIPAQAPMPRYRCHKLVRALKIQSIELNATGATITPAEPGYSPFHVGPDYVMKHSPEPGGYFVQYEDGYVSFSPAEPFESGYTPIDSIEKKLARELARNIADADHARELAPQLARPPSPGRIVLYNHPGSADGKYPPSQSPAIIQKVYENGAVDLWVFGPKGIHKDGPLFYGDGPCQWQWPRRL